MRLIGEAAKCFVHADSLGSIRLETTAGGAAGLRQTYKPFGDRMVTAEGACAGEEKGYIGERHDEEAGLLYLHARWYDPAPRPLPAARLVGPARHERGARRRAAGPADERGRDEPVRVRRE